MKSWQERISIDNQVRFGKPCITGTRIAVLDILGWLANGMSYDDIMADFPSLTREDILAALAFAANREENTRILVSA
ncbi:DUF433 domain-containing protein [Dyadobacter sp. Leaf189]|uniref:DUF433 domain-containing protein n=1 Tax=Dyadobacter sp. Leaf189 TaxID=1736295 RepID=UPI0006F8B637|nr:DUF433 domain-containing protein [Dyadobacter sp. Leaf189]KQS34112.1 hypothetical protein ASG33_08855 [Dyadobacter sp. Leaf189]